MIARRERRGRTRGGPPSRALVGGTVFTVAVASFARIPLLPEIARDLDLQTADIGLLVGAFGLGRVLADLPAGRLAHAGSTLRGFAAAGAVLGVSTIGLAVSQGLAAALVASLISGVASAIANTLGMYAFATGSTPERRGAGMAAYSTALMAGLTLGPAFGGLLAGALGWRAALWVAAGIGFAVALVSVARERLPVREAEPVSAAAPSAPVLVGATPEAAAELGPGGPLRRRALPAGRIELAVLAAVPLVGFLAYASLIQTLVPIIGDERLGLSPSTVGLTIAVAGSTRFISAWIAGIASDRLSRRVVLLPTIACTAAAAALLAVPGRAPWVGSIVLLGLGSASISVAAAALADRVAPQELGRQMAVFRLTGDMGLLVGPVATGVLYAAAGPGAAAGLVAAAAGASALAVAMIIREPT